MNDVPKNLPIICVEVLAPPSCPESILFYVESARIHHNSKRFVESIEALQAARKLWLQAIVLQHEEDNKPLSYHPEELYPEAELFFAFQMGVSLIALGCLDDSFTELLESSIDRALTFSDRLSVGSPDRSLGHTLQGSYYYSVKQQYEKALKSFGSAKVCRETILGVSPIDLGTVYNNLGCALIMNNQTLEGLQFLNDSLGFFSSSLGLSHPKSATVLYNVSLARRIGLDNLPQLPIIPPPKVAEQKKGKKGKKGKKKGKKGKKGTKGGKKKKK
ncbi:hypothetical protein P9112_000981 [Eukaryota sp. TZLM1-RC]